MGNATDILKELQDIGAVGDRVQEVVVRRPKPIPLVEIVSEPVSAAPTVVLPNEIVIGLSQQIAALQKTLRGVLRWCEAAQETLADSYAQESDDVGEEPVDEEVVVDAVAEEQTEGNEEEGSQEPIPPPPPLEAAKPKLSLEEIRKHFLDPQYSPKKVNGNGVSAAIDPAVPPETKEEPNG